MDERQELIAVADLLAEVIAFLLPYKCKIIDAVLVDKRNSRKGEYEVIAKDIIFIRRRFEKVKGTIKDPVELLIWGINHLKALDEMIDMKIGMIVGNSANALEETDFIRFEKGLNSDASRELTNLTIIPRFKTSWEGSGEDREILSDSFNRILNRSRYVELENSLVAGKYKVNSVIISRNASINRKTRKRDESVIRIGMCPMSMDFELQKEENTDIYFYQKPWGVDDINRINDILLKAISKAEEERLNILIFPEMLGYPKIEMQAYKYMHQINCQYLKLVVLPTVWEKVDGEGHNTAYLVHSGKVATIFSQEKLVPFYDDEVKEAIVPADEINLLFDEVHGCIGILICKSELEDSVRNLFVRDLGVKLIICPSWSPGTHSFETTTLANAQWNANVIWTNTCSAFKSKTNKNLIKQPVCIVTHYWKAPGRNNLHPEKFYPLKMCSKECQNGKLCLFVTEIKGKRRK